MRRRKAQAKKKEREKRQRKLPVGSFTPLWEAWKFGRGDASQAAKKRTLLATAQMLQGLEGNGGCNASLRYLRNVRDLVLSRVREHAGQEPLPSPLTLWRGIRGGPEAEAFRNNAEPTTASLLSYSTRKGAAMGFASFGNDADAPGLLYSCEVADEDIIFFESLLAETEGVTELKDECEVLILHRSTPRSVKIEEREVKARFKPKFGKKTAIAAR